MSTPTRLALLALALATLMCSAQASSPTRWINAAPVLVRAEGRADAPVIGRLQQSTQVQLIRQEPNNPYCQVELHDARLGHVACRYLSEQPVAPRRAGVDGVPADRRWSVGSGLVLRDAPNPTAAVRMRLPLNTELTLLAEPSPGRGYCEVRTLPVGPVPAEQGYTACAFLKDTPLLLQRLEQAVMADGKPNPDFNPRKVFAVTPSWESMARYAAQQVALCGMAGRCAAQDKDMDAELDRMRRLLHGLRLTYREALPALVPWAGFDAALDLGGERPPKSLQQALPPLPAARPSWFQSAAEFAGPDASLSQLAQHFDAAQQWFVGSLYDGRRTEGLLEETRVERLTRALHRIELLSDDSVRAPLQTPQFENKEWRPDVDFMCQNWSGIGYAFGDAHPAALQRNGGQPPTPARIGPRRLFWFHSSRPLPPGPVRVVRETFKMDRKSTGFASGELRRIDLDADGEPDLIWFEGTGRGPGHLGDPPAHDDPWFRLLLVNLNGQWMVLGRDAFSFGCGC